MWTGFIENTEKQTDRAKLHQEMMQFAKEKGLNLGCVVFDDSFEKARISLLPSCEGVLVHNISGLGASLAEVKDNLQFCKQHKLSIQSIEEGYNFNIQNLTDEFFKGIEIAIEVRSRLISKNTKKVLQQKKDEGKKLGRPYGAIVKKRLDGKEEEIRQLLLQKVTKAEIARHFGVSRITVFNFIKDKGLENKENNIVKS